MEAVEIIANVLTAIIFGAAIIGICLLIYYIIIPIILTIFGLIIVIGVISLLPGPEWIIDAVVLLAGIKILSGMFK